MGFKIYMSVCVCVCVCVRKIRSKSSKPQPESLLIGVLSFVGYLMQNPVLYIYR